MLENKKVFRSLLIILVCSVVMFLLFNLEFFLRDFSFKNDIKSFYDKPYTLSQFMKEKKYTNFFLRFRVEDRKITIRLNISNNDILIGSYIIQEGQIERKFNVIYKNNTFYREDGKEDKFLKGFHFYFLANGIQEKEYEYLEHASIIFNEDNRFIYKNKKQFMIYLEKQKKYLNIQENLSKYGTYDIVLEKDKERQKIMLTIHDELRYKKVEYIESFWNE